MGLIICAKHGNQVIADTSPEIADCIRNNKRITFETEKIYLDIGNKEKAIYVVDKEYADDLRKKYGIKDEIISLQEEEYVFEVVCSLEPVCEKCYQEFMKAYGKSG